MRFPKYLKILTLLVLAGGAGCTKLEETYKSTFPADQAAAALGPQGVSLLLQSAYNDIIGGSAFVDQAGVFSLQENSSDESLVVTRGGDWDDNGVWRVVHNHSWDADHSQVLNVFNALNKISFDATNVLNFNPSPAQAAEARFLRAFALYTLLDLYNQYPFRNPGDTLLNAPKVLTGNEAVQFIIDELTAVLPDFKPTNSNQVANADACKMLLMKCYLNRGAFNNRANPTFDDADMQQVITLGEQIINGGKYSYEANYFSNFNFTNKSSKEAIWMYPCAGSGSTTNNPGMQSHYERGFHYNEYTPKAPGAGWNGFTTMSSFYSTFSLTGTVAFSQADAALDTRLGNRATSDPTCTINSGIKPGFLIGLQKDQNGVALKDRKGAPLDFTPVIAPDMIEQGSNLEVTGIRVSKYVPDFSDPTGLYFNSNSGMSLILFRYPDAVLMVAEAYLRAASPDASKALTLVNDLRTARGAAAMAGPLVLNNPSNVEDPQTLLAERGRELYWEQVRRTDLIRFKAYQLPWQYKPASGDDPKYLVYPIPNSSLAVNPNLKQNPGY